MRNQIHTSAIALVLLLASAGFAMAANNDGMGPQDRLTLSAAQELAIVQSISTQELKRETAPSGFEAELGQAAPKSITLHTLPSGATGRVPTAKQYDHAMLQNQLLIINPRDRIVVDVIGRDVASN
jgi:hypothetical protein